MNENVREKIARAAYEVEVQQFGGFDWEYAKEFSGSNDVPLYELDGAYEIADKVLALVREAMLSKEALMELRFVDDVREGMEAALAAIGLSESEVAE